MRRQSEGVAGDPADQALLNRRDLVLGALAMGGGAVVTAALAPAEAQAAFRDVVKVGVPAITNEANDQIAAFDGLNSGAGPGMIIESARHDAIRGIAYGANRSVLYAYHKGDGWGVYAIGRRAGVYGQASLGPGVKGVSSAGDGLEGTTGATGKSGLYAHHSGDGWGVVAAGKRAGVRGYASTGPGVHGISESADGVLGQTNAPNKSGVYAFNDNPNMGTGVYAHGGAYGVRTSSKSVGIEARGSVAAVRADSDEGWGVYATTKAPYGAGVYCHNSAATGTGCIASGGRNGLYAGASTAAGTGVYAENIHGGFGLEVRGKTRLERSGVATTVVGYAYKNVTVPGSLTAASKFLVTMQGSPGAGVYVTYAKYLSATQFRVYFNKACTAAAKLAWMVLD